ncbi:MAG: aminoacyl-tRNA hydrolase [Succinivibrionaceae bacterium]|nr:aminoacyl-tRNA hydrolase [Succinivibrionaceae bacterium]
MGNEVPPLRLVVGLGNPGPTYEHTRHNLGVDLLLRLADSARISLLPEARFHGLTGRGAIEGHDLRLLFPTTFMNESGRSVGALATFYKIAPGEILVIHDDLDLLPGQMRLKRGGGLAGHNGLKSICACLGGSQDFFRLRLGIGRPPGTGTTINWVLGRPSREEREKIDAAADHALLAFSTLLTRGLDRAVEAVNGFRI